MILHLCNLKLRRWFVNSKYIQLKEVQTVSWLLNIKYMVHPYVIDFGGFR